MNIPELNSGYIIYLYCPSILSVFSILFQSALAEKKFQESEQNYPPKCLLHKNRRFFEILGGHCFLC